jgi:hypothetical protein
VPVFCGILKRKFDGLPVPMGIEQPDHLSRVSQDRFMVHLVVVDPHREGVWALNLDLLVPRQWFLHPEESGHGDLIPPAAAVP